MKAKGLGYGGGDNFGTGCACCNECWPGSGTSFSDAWSKGGNSNSFMGEFYSYPTFYCAPYLNFAVVFWVTKQ